MQIHELTQKLTQLSEANVLDYVKAISTKDPALRNPNLTVSQRAQAISQNKQLNQMATKAYQAWNQKYAQLMKVNGGQPLSPGEYAAELKAFVEQVLLPKYIPYNSLSNKIQLDAAINNAVAKSNTPAALSQAFQRIVDLAALSREINPAAQALGAAHGAMTGGNPPQQPGAAAPATLSQPVTIGGQTLNPRDPADAAILQKLQAQGQIPSQNSGAASATAVVNALRNPKFTPQVASARVKQLLASGPVTPQNVRNWASQIPAGNLPTRVPQSGYPIVDELVSQLLGIPK